MSWWMAVAELLGEAIDGLVQRLRALFKRAAK